MVYYPYICAFGVYLLAINYPAILTGSVWFWGFIHVMHYKINVPIIIS